MLTKTVCLYHRADLDGKCSAAIVEYFYKYNYQEDITLYGVNYGDDFTQLMKEVNKDTNIIMVDFCFQPFSLMLELKDKVKSFIWIDHHQESIKAYRSLIEDHITANGNKIDWNHPTLFRGNQSIGEAGCELTWKYFFPDKKMPPGIYLLGRYDVWDWQNVDDSIEFQYGLRLEETDPVKGRDLWRTIINYNEHFTNDIIEQGRTVLRYQKQQNEIHAKSAAFEVEFNNMKWIAINEMFNSSTLFDSVYDPSKHHGMLTFGYRRKQWYISLYTTRDDVNVGEIATAIGKELNTGGGGHAKAAGFQCKQLPFVL